MTDHKGLPVAGYKPQSAENVALVNEFKAFEERLLRKLDRMAEDEEYAKLQNGSHFDMRFVAIARTHFQEGFMSLNRAVFQPSRIALPEDAQ